MIPTLAAAVVVLAAVVALNLLLTFAILRRLRTMKESGGAEADTHRPPVGTPVGRFDAVSDDGFRLTDEDLRHGLTRFAFVMPGCGPCEGLLSALRPGILSDRTLLVVVAEEAGHPDAVAMRESIPDDLRVFFAPLGSPMCEAFQMAVFPSVVEVAGGRMIAIADTIAAAPNQPVAA
ncbi:hypothetical protein [Hamadaea tsunoensis]|uniref:hypothetical protein n=1 Tax=Hamadaea tsunoensis TaxID=53368 RepID=UPI000409B829|nr:hypothetical protein [Hamadaea tsunoensis]